MSMATTAWSEFQKLSAKAAEEVKAAKPETPGKAEDDVQAKLDASDTDVYLDRDADVLYLSNERSSDVYSCVSDPIAEGVFRVPYDAAGDYKLPYKVLPLRSTPTTALVDGLDAMARHRWLTNDDRDYVIRLIDGVIGDELVDAASLYVRLKCMQLADVKFGTRLGGRLIPLNATVHRVSTRRGSLVYVSGECQICDRLYSWGAEAEDDFFCADGVHSRSFTTDEALEKLGLVRLTDADQAALSDRLVRARALNMSPGQVMDVKGDVLVVYRTLFGQRLGPLKFGSAESPIACVTEDELDAAQTRDRFREVRDKATCAPYVRLFDFKRRDYVYADVDDLAPYEFDAGALDKLEVDPDYRDLLRGLFTSESGPAQVEDLIRGKNGGVIILASGPPGTGKTMTAECLGEITRRPIYSIGLADLGTDLDEVSHHLDAIITRAERWNALLLIDEADVLLKRRGDDLTRSAIVGLFLHRIEYFRGYLFLTSNLPDELDPAVLSRVTIHRRYPAHTTESRARVWRRLLDHAGLAVPDDAVSALSVRPIDGRNIRSVVKLTRMLNPAGSELTRADLERVLAFSAAELAA